MGVILAVLAAVVYGSGDFYGGLSAKRSSIWAVLIVSGVFGLATVLLAAPWLSPGAPPRNDIVIGAIAGVVSPAAIGALYRGLAIARMSVVAPITAVIASVIPVAFGFLRGERPSPLVWTGIAIAVLAVALVSSSSDEDVTGEPEPRRRGISEAVIAGSGFGILYVLLSQTSHGLWPLVAVRCVSVPLIVVIALSVRGQIAPSKGSLGSLALAGIFDMGGNILYLLSLRHTLIAIAAVITSLYPASTVMLARLVLNERLRSVQWVGVICVFFGVAMIGLG